MTDNAKERIVEEEIQETEILEAKIQDEEIRQEEEVPEEPVEASTTEASTTSEEVEAPDAAQSLEDLLAALETAQADAAKNLDGWQRTAAELANYKRRQEEQAGRQRDDIRATILDQILPVLDDFDLAFQNIPEALGDQEHKWVEGFDLIRRKLDKILENQRVQVIDTNGLFDPTLHEAITHEENDEHEEGHIIAEVRKGYRMGDRVLRPALVRVAK